MSNEESLINHRSDNIELSHTAALAEDTLRGAAEVSKTKAAEAREAGQHETASIHDMFAQAEHTEARQIGEKILEREAPRSPEP
jgi:hypothetical protein